MGVRKATHVGCDSAYSSPLIHDATQAHNTAQQNLLCWGWGAIPGPADAEFDSEELSPRFLSPCHQLLPATVEAAPRLGCLPEPQGSLAAASSVPCPARKQAPLSHGQLAARTAAVTFTWVNPGEQGFQLA